jgi:hypothetical protein
MAKVPEWSTYCPECKAKISLAVTIKEAPPSQQKPGKYIADVRVDTSRMREHMRTKHPERYPQTPGSEPGQQGTQLTESKD